VTERLEALQREQIWSKTSQDAIEEVQDALKALEDELLELATEQERIANKAEDISQLALVQPSSSGEEGGQPQAVALTAKVEGEDVAAVVADWTGIPSQKMMVDQYNIVSRLEEALAERLIGQKAAIHIICDKIRAFTAKLHDPSRPMGVFMLAGTSGVGKTETAHALADVFFATSGMTVVNMSEYQESHTVSKLKGAPAGYVGYGQGGVLTEAIRRRPYGLLLLDEIEKAHPDVMNLFMQVFDKGFMEDSEGVRVDFKNTLVIMTTNAGTDVLEELTQEKSLEYQNELPPGLQDSLLRHFAPAFLGRAHVVPYYPLGSVELKAITGLKLKAVCDRFHLAYKKNLGYDDSLLDFIVEKALSKTIGARWIDQYISKSVTNNLATYVLDTLATGRPILDSEIVAIDGLICVRQA
jgi:type VI secretion system protein VasG